MSSPERCSDHLRLDSASGLALAWLIGASLAMTTQACAPLPAARPADPAGQPRLSVSYGKLPLSFEVNRGQSDERVKFLARGQGYSLFLTPAEGVLSLHATRPGKHAEVEHAATGRRAEPDAPAQPAAVVRMRLVGANTHPELTGLDPLPGKSNYFIGNDPERWQRDVPNYARVKYSGVYPGIDLVYYGNQRELEYDLVVAPGADPTRIALAFDGVRKLSLDLTGNLVLETSKGNLIQHRPVIYQDIGGERRQLAGHYVLRASRRVGFHVARYDTTRPLIIDPQLSYSTYLGGGGNDVGNAIALDTAGNAYVTGVTDSTDFPGASVSPIQPMLKGSVDVFVTKLNAAGSALIYSTYLGGSLAETGFAIAVDSTGNAYVTGETNSTTVPGPGVVPFPTVGAFQPLYGLGGDAFISKINAAGNALVYSTYLGLSGTDRGTGIAVDGSGNAYVTGQTNGTFPIAAAFQPLNGGSVDAFVTKMNAAGNALVYSTYLGGTGSENSVDGGAIAVDSDGNAYVAGTTASVNFPGASTSTIQALNGGGFNDGFVAKFNAAGSALLYSTYLGGNDRDGVHGIAIDTGRNAYVAGVTESSNFPTASPLQAMKNGSGSDAFVSKLNAAGSALVYSTYLGGTGAGDTAYAVAVDSGGRAYVSGFTNSNNFPTVQPIQATNGLLADAFVSELNAAGALAFSTYLGGNTGHEHGYGIAVDAFGNAYVTGKTNSTNFPTASPFQSIFGGSGDDAFVAKIIINGAHVPTNVTATATSTSSVTITWTGGGNVALYQVHRQGGCCGVFQTTTDTFMVQGANPGASYLYTVRAFETDSGPVTAFSAPDMATTVLFTDDPLVVSSTFVKATHVMELRTAVNAVRFLSTELGAPFPPFPFTDGSLISFAIKKTHVEELRGALDQARAAMGLPTIAYTDPVLTSGVTAIKAAHIEQLRTGVK